MFNLADPQSLLGEWITLFLNAAVIKHGKQLLCAVQRSEWKIAAVQPLQRAMTGQKMELCGLN